MHFIAFSADVYFRTIAESKQFVLGFFLIENDFEMNIINIMEILGTVGGFYEILYVFSSIFVKRIVERFFK